MKTCKVCGQAKEAEAFRPKRAVCTPCSNAAARLRMAAYRATPDGRAAAADASKRWKAANPEKVVEQHRRRRVRQGQPGLTRDEQAAVREADRAVRALERSARRLHDAHVKAWKQTLTPSELWAHRYKTDPNMQMRERLRTMLRKHAKQYAWIASYFGSYAKRQGGGRIWSIVGYSATELREHLERQFVAGMTWERFLAGQIHIDHIVPKSRFDLDSIDELRACYALSNLRPLWATVNVRDGARRALLC